MYAVLRYGSTQFNRVQIGDELDVLCDIDSFEAGKPFGLDVLLICNDDEEVQIGAPCVEGYEAKAVCVEIVKGHKGISYKYKRRKQYHKKHGYRASYVRVKVMDIAPVAA